MERGIYHRGEATAVGSDEGGEEDLCGTRDLGRQEGRKDGGRERQRDGGEMLICVYNCFIVKVIYSSRCA
jgi:hypothetical protein